MTSHTAETHEAERSMTREEFDRISSPTADDMLADRHYLTDEPTLPKAAAILDDARNTICGPRQESYGHPSRNIGDIAKMWSVVLGTEVTARQVCKCMVALKLARDVNKPGYDNVVDSLGYLALIEEVDVGCSCGLNEGCSDCP